MKQARQFRILLVLLVLARGQALWAARKETWVVVRSPHFVAYSDAGISEVHGILREFEEIRGVFRGVFPGLRVDTPKPVILLVFRDEDSMKRLIPGEFEGKNPKRSSGVYVSCSDRNYAIVRLDAPHQAEQPYFVVFHEYTHGIVHLNFPSLPTWLDEGIADFYGATEIRSDRVLVGKVPLGRLETMRNSAFLPLETLLTVNSTSPHYREGDKTGVFYSQSWALVHYLFMDERAQKAGLFQKYLKALQENPDLLAAAKAGFGDLGAFQGALSSYTRQPVFRYWIYNLSAKLIDKDFKSGNLDEAEVLVVKADFLQSTGREKEAQPILQRALELAPESPGVKAAMGYGHYLRRERTQAIAAFDEAMRLGSDDFRPPYYLARLAQEQGNSTPEETSRILEYLETARRLCPDFPGIHMLLCREYAREPKQAAKAIEEGRQAVELDPQNLSYRANLGYACMSLNLVPQAKAIAAQLNVLALNPLEKMLNQKYTADLKRFLDQREAKVAEPLSAMPTNESPSGGIESLKFRLPESLAPLGREVLHLVGDGKSLEAIKKVEAALSKARNEWDRKALQAMLDKLRTKSVSASSKGEPPKKD